MWTLKNDNNDLWLFKARSQLLSQPVADNCNCEWK